MTGQRSNQLSYAPVEQPGLTGEPGLSQHGLNSVSPSVSSRAPNDSLVEGTSFSPRPFTAVGADNSLVYSLSTKGSLMSGVEEGRRVCLEFTDFPGVDRPWLVKKAQVIEDAMSEQLQGAFLWHSRRGL